LTDDASADARVAWAPDGKKFITWRDEVHKTGKGPNVLKIIEFWNAAPVKATGIFTGPFLDFFFPRDGKTLGIIENNAAAVLLDLDKRNPVGGINLGPLYQPAKLQDALVPIVLSGNGTALFLGQFNRVDLWDLGKRGKVQTFEHPLPVYRVAISADGKLGATACGTFGRLGIVRVWDLQTGKALLSIPHDGPIALLQFSPDGRVLATRNDRDLRFWSIDI
jgi:WD40 repeat protein